MMSTTRFLSQFQRVLHSRHPAVRHITALPSTANKSSACPTSCRCCNHTLDAIQRRCLQTTSHNSAEAEPAKTYPPHLTSIVDQISQLTLMEVSELNELLKIRLNIADTAPMMPMGGMPMMAAPTVAEEEEEPEEVVVQTEFKVTLKSFDAKSKIKLIKEIKNLMPELNLVQAKKFVEEVPQVLKESVSREDADALEAALKAVDAVVEIS